MRVATTRCNFGGDISPVTIDGDSCLKAPSKNKTNTYSEIDYSSGNSSSSSNSGSNGNNSINLNLGTNASEVSNDVSNKNWWDRLADLNNVLMYGDLAYANYGTNDPYTQTVNASATWGFLDVLENLGDGLLMLCGTMAAAEQYSMAANAWGSHQIGLMEVADQNAQSIKDVTAAAVKYDWSEAGYDKTVNALGIDEEIAYGDAHTYGTAVGQIGGNIALGLVGGPGVQAALGGFQAYGSTAETALKHGATFDEANAAGMGSGMIGAGAGYGMDVLADTAKTAGSVGKALGYTGLATTIGVVDPLANAGIEYVTYANDMVDENGNKIYNSFGDYYQQSGGSLNSWIGGITGVLRVGGASLSGLLDSKLKTDIDGSSNLGKPIETNSQQLDQLDLLSEMQLKTQMIGADTSSMSLEEMVEKYPDIYDEIISSNPSLSNVMKPYFDEKIKANYISAVVEDKILKLKETEAKKMFWDDDPSGDWWKLDNNKKQEYLDKVKIAEAVLQRNKLEYEEIARNSIDEIIRLKENGHIKPDFSVGDVLSMIRDDVSQETYLTESYVNAWIEKFGPVDSNGKITVYLVQDASNSYALKSGTIGPPNDLSNPTNTAGNGGAFVMCQEQFNKLLNNEPIYNSSGVVINPKPIFSETGELLDSAELKRVLGGVNIPGDMVVIKQVIPASILELPRGSNKGSYFGDWRPGGTTSSGLVEGLVPQNFTSDSSNGIKLPDTEVEISIIKKKN